MSWQVGFGRPQRSPVVVALAVSIVRDLMAGRMGVDVIALLSMSGAIALNQSLAAIVVAIMYTGGTLLEDYAVTRAERNLKSLVDRSRGLLTGGRTKRSKTLPSMTSKSGMRSSYAREKSFPSMG